MQSVGTRKTRKLEHGQLHAKWNHSSAGNLALGELSQ